jgi:glucose/arabinose dehydrogenase
VPTNVPRTTRRRMPRSLAAAAALVLLVPAVAGAFPEVDFDPDSACPDGLVPDSPFTDVGPQHADAAGCLAWHGIMQGTTLTTFAPLRPLTRGQVASVVHRILLRVGDLDVPEPRRGAFPDVTGGPHRDAIETLAAFDPPIVRGITADRFEPTAPVTRAQYASFLVRALDEVAAQRDDIAPLAAATSPFPDVTGGPHLDAVARLAAAEVARGFVDGTYGPTRSINRGQAANLTVRSLGGLVATGAMPLPGPQPDLEVEVTLTEVATLDAAIAGAVGPDGTFYLADRGGTVHPLTPDGAGPAVLDLSDETTTDGERGLLGIVFSDDGSELYTSSTDLEGDTVIQAFAVDAGTIDSTDRREVFTLPQPQANHNGGDVRIGPDGMLYIALGDGGGSGDPQEAGQDRSTALGTILRIDPQGGDPYAIPDDNPFVGEDGVVEEIWAWGLRNPWRFSFDALTGELWIADVGQNEREEVNLLPAPPRGGGANLGWNLMEGTLEFAGPEPDDHVPPVYEYDTRGPEGCSITGGVVYRGDAIEDLWGAYLYSDFCNGDVRALVAQQGLVVDQGSLDVDGGQVVGFATDAAGEVYVFDLGGSVWRLDPVS